MTVTTIAIDAMGGDVGPSVTIPAAISILQTSSQLKLILVGDETVLTKILAQHHYDASRLSLQHASQQVAMDENPAHALRNKKDSSMRIAINLVKAGKAQACVSAGNTGALMVTARFVLKTLPGIDRPAILSGLPSAQKNKTVRMLDLGANVDSSAENLIQFAVMGSVVAESVDGIEQPSVRLLNIGEEDIKGNEQVKKTAELLANMDGLNYQGYIEGDDIFSGGTDVIVCDGFVGNIALKTTEGVVKFIFGLMRSAFKQNVMTKLIGLAAKPIMRRVVSYIDPDRHNGAVLIGLNGTVIKSHGSASVIGFVHAIKEAQMCAEKNIPELIRARVQSLLDPSLFS